MMMENSNRFVERGDRSAGPGDRMMELQNKATTSTHDK